MERKLCSVVYFPKKKKNVLKSNARAVVNKLFHFHGKLNMNVIRVGQTLPSVELAEGTPLTRVNLNEICSNKKIILVGVVGAFIPNCSDVHLPGFLERYPEIKKKGYHDIICVTVNDIFVTQAWGQMLGLEGKVRLLADPDAELATALGLDMNIPTLCGTRSKRFSMTAVNNVVKYLAVESDGIGLTSTLAEKLII